MAKTGKCLDCGEIIKRESKRCRSCAAKARWAMPGFKQRMSTKMKAMWQLPGFRKQRLKIMRSPEYRQGQSRRRKAFLQDNPEAMNQLTKAFLGKTHTSESRQKMSDLMKMRWQDSEYRKSQIEILHSHKAKRKKAMSLKKAHARGDFDSPETLHKQSRAAQANWASGIYDHIFQGPTSIEQEMAAALDILGIEHSSQFRPPNTRWIFDEFIPPNIVVEIHGDYWHGPKRPKRQKKDRRKEAWAKENDYDLIIVWEHEIKKYGAWALAIERILPMAEEMNGRNQ